VNLTSPSIIASQSPEGTDKLDGSSQVASNADPREGINDQGKPQDCKGDPVEDIAVYRLGTFDMDDTASMIAFYLWMRRTQYLAIQYMEETTAHSLERISEISEIDNSLYNWFNPPKSGSRVGPKSGSESSKKRKREDMGSQAQPGSGDGCYVCDEHYASGDYEMDYGGSESDDQSDSTPESIELPSVSSLDEITREESRKKVSAFIENSRSIQSQGAPSAMHLMGGDETT
ncbi:hypothetical protein FRC11_009205, partial [Ceratobasidium sp. 423]